MTRDEHVRALMEARMSGQLSRRDLIRRLALLGLAAPTINAILAACGSDESDSGGSGAQATSAPTSAASSGGSGTPATSGTGIEGQDFEGQTLVVTSYGGTWEEFMRQEIIPDFEAQTGAKIELAVGLSKDWMTKLRAAGKDNPPYDVVIANETYIATARVEGHFISLPEDKIPNLADVHEKMKMPDNVGVFFLIGPVGIAYMTEKVSEPPKSWMDLAKFTGKLGIYNAANSACAQHIMMMAKIVNGGDYKNWEPGFEWIRDNLKPNKQTDFSGDMEKLLTTGEVDVGILDAPAWARLSNQGVAMEWVAPEEGLLMFEQNTNVTAGSKVKDLAFAWVNYLLSVPVQKKWAENYWYTPANTKVEISGDLARYIPVTGDTLEKIEKWDYVWLNEGPRDQMINRWNREMSG